MLLMQALFWLIAGISALPFALGGEVFMAALGVVTMLLALATLMLAIGVLWRRRRARSVVLALEVMCLFSTAVLLLLPFGFSGGVASSIVSGGLPAAASV